jgi:hypothetical protein
MVAEFACSSSLSQRLAFRSVLGNKTVSVSSVSRIKSWGISNFPSNQHVFLLIVGR